MVYCNVLFLFGYVYINVYNRFSYFGTFILNCHIGIYYIIICLILQSDDYLAQKDENAVNFTLQFSPRNARG